MGKATHIRDKAFSDEDRTNITEFTKSLNKWLVGCDEIWCQRPKFDMVIIENLYKMHNTLQTGHIGNSEIAELYSA